MLMFAQV